MEASVCREQVFACLPVSCPCSYSASHAVPHKHCRGLFLTQYHLPHSHSILRKTQCITPSQKALIPPALYPGMQWTLQMSLKAVQVAPIGVRRLVKGNDLLTADNVFEDRSKSSLVLVSPCPLMSKATTRYLQE